MVLSLKYEKICLNNNIFIAEIEKKLKNIFIKIVKCFKYFEFYGSFTFKKAKKVCCCDF